MALGSSSISLLLRLVMWQERQAELLREEIKAILSPLSGAKNFSDLVKETLARTRRGLGVESAEDKPWPLLPLVVCEAISGYWEQALPVAAAIQLFTAAADVFDDVEDDDSSGSLSARYGPAVATNVATTLLFLAEKAMMRLKERGVDDATVVRVMEAVNSYYITACAGQHLDIFWYSNTTVSEAQYLKIIEMKTAAQLGCACHAGALLASANEGLIDAVSTFGHNLGMAAQIANDIQGIMDDTDILKSRITLPVIYALAQTGDEVRQQLELAFSKEAKPASQLGRTRDLLFRTGAIHYATLQMELYKQRAMDALSVAEAAGVSSEKLRLFVA